MKLRLHQFNSITGKPQENCHKMLAALAQAAEANVDLVVFSKGSLTGFMLEDQARSKFFLETAESYLKLLAEKSQVAAVISLPDRCSHLNNFLNLEALKRQIFSPGLLRTLDDIKSFELPRNDDEASAVVARHETSAPAARKGEAIQALKLCRRHSTYQGNYLSTNTWKNLLIKNGQVTDASNLLDEYGIVLENSPFVLGQAKSQHSRMCLNAVGWQEEFFFDGESFVSDGQGNLLAQLKSCEEDYLDVLIDGESLKVLQLAKRTSTNEIEKIYKVLVLSLRDYMAKNNFKRAVLGLSGGIDSALVATIAADAIGGKNLHCVRLPSMFSSDHSLTDAAELASALGSTLNTIPIRNIYDECNKSVANLFADQAADVAEENLQARIRGTLLMSISNKFGELLLNTGNKSEGSVGYATLYGDTCGGFSVLKDIYKTTVYKLARWRNENWLDIFYGPQHHVIPENIFIKEPSAELRPEQKDSDSLPEYEVLDKILKALIEKNQSSAEILKAGIDEAVLAKVVGMISRSEYKRRQSPPGVVIAGKYKKYSL